jgi:hypothetical protein
MSGILHSTEEAFIMFVANRIAESDWKNMLSPSHILSRMEDDDENEIKDYVWDEVKASINWNSILNEIRTMALNLAETEEEEAEEEEQAEESD